MTNASGAPGRIAAVGSPVAADNDLRLSATSLPAQSGGDAARFAARLRSTGSFSIEVDLTAIPTNPNQPVLAGQTWNFQA